MKRANCNSVWRGIALPFILLFVVFSNNSKAQTVTAYNAGDTLSIQLRAVWSETGIALRWAPLNYTSWKYAHQFGFSLDRYLVARNGVAVSEGEFENSIHHYDIMPMNKQEMEDYMEQHPGPNGDAPSTWGIAHAAYYAPTFEATTGGTQQTDYGALVAYNIAKERDNRFGFCLLAADQDFLLAQAIGLGYNDIIHVDPEERYLYVLKFGGNPDSLQLYSKEKTLYIDRESGALTMRQPSKPSGHGGDRSAFLTWDISQIADQYVSYSLQRAAPNSPFITINSNPIINTSDIEPDILHYGDQLPQNNVWYSYRVVGRTPFGIESAPSDTVRIKGRPKPIDFTPYILNADLVNSNNFSIDWEFPDSLNAKINGFEVWNSETHDGTPSLVTQVLLPAYMRALIDPLPHSTNYYTVVALDKNGYRLTSLPKFAQLNDATPPVKPIGLHGSVDKTGAARLWWTPNGENDLQGYRVFSCDQPEGEYAEITGYWIHETEYHLTLNPKTLHEIQYFKVAALDIRENQSELSDWIPLQLVDIVPPIPPVIVNIEALPTGVRIDFEPSTSADVVKHEVQRKQVSQKTWQTIATLPKEQYPIKVYVDEKAETLEDYHYQVVAIDDAGLTATTPIRHIQALGMGIRPSVQNLGVILDVFPFQHNGTSPMPIKPGKFKVAKLTWRYDAKHRNVEEFWIYRSIVDAETGQVVRVLWKAVSPSDALNGKQIVVEEGATGTSRKEQNTFFVEDDDVHLIAKQHPEELKYQVMVRFDDGTVSALSQPVNPQ